MERAPGRQVGLSIASLALALAGCRDVSLDLTLGDASVAPGDDGGPTTPPVLHCSVPSQCADTGVPMCSEEAGICVECLSSADCSGSTPHCLDGGCVSCTTNADCSTGMVCNTHIPRCATQCTDGTECNGKACATAYGYCVECLSDLDCVDASLPFCFEPPAVGLCVGCRSSADCIAGDICGPARRCGPP
jgi:Cys-rich repeat protein